MKITRDDVLDAALRTLDEEGLERLSMRAVAGRLGVQASALYWHVGDKDELLAAMAGHFHARAFASVPGDLPWRDWLRAYGIAFRASLLAHRGSARLCAVANPSVKDSEERGDALAAPLVAQGIARHEALSFVASVISLALGWAIYEQNEAMHDYLERMVGFERSFITGLDAMVAGFEPAARAIRRRS